MEKSEKEKKLWLFTQILLKISEKRLQKPGITNTGYTNEPKLHILQPTKMLCIGPAKDVDPAQSIRISAQMKSSTTNPHVGEKVPQRGCHLQTKGHHRRHFLAPTPQFQKTKKRGLWMKTEKDRERERETCFRREREGEKGCELTELWRWRWRWNLMQKSFAGVGAFDRGYCHCVARGNEVTYVLMKGKFLFTRH